MDNNSQPDCNGSLSDDTRNLLVAILSSGGFAGVLSCSTALALLVFFKMYMHFSERMSLYLLLSGLSLASIWIFMLVGVGPLDFAHHHHLCQAFGFLLQYSMWTMVLLTTFITFHLASLVLFHKMLERLELFYILFTLIFPLLSSWIPFLTDSYGLAGAWCWIRTFDDSACSFNQAGVIEQGILWFAPVSIILTGNSIVMVAISVVLCHRSFSKTSHLKSAIYEHNRDAALLNEVPNYQYKEALKNNFPLFLYPIMNNFFTLIAMISRIQQAISPGSTYAMWIIHTVSNAIWPSALGVSVIICMLAKKLTKQNIEKAARSWKHTFTRIKMASMGVGTANHPPSDVFTAEGYTETSPTAWEPESES